MEARAIASGARAAERCLGFFFFQAEDGIRDYKVTGVQTCALPIWQMEAENAAVQARLHEFVSQIPNVPHESVPLGSRPEDSVELRRWGEPRTFDFQPRDHVDVGAGLGGLDFDTAAKLAGSRFVVMKGQAARLHRALAQFMLDVHTSQHGYTEVYTPYMVSGACADGVTSLAKFKIGRASCRERV